MQLRAQLQAQGQDPAQAEAALAALGNAAGGGEVNVQDMGVIEALLRSLVGLRVARGQCRQQIAVRASTINSHTVADCPLGT